MIQDQRVLHQSTDISLKVNDFRAGIATFTYTAGQYLYIGQNLPFQNLWFELGTLNIVPATVSIQVWYANQWQNVVDVLDETVGLTQTGRIQWTVDRDKGWEPEDESEDITGLAGTKIYDKYWLRMSWSATLTAGVTIKYVGQKFANDAVFYSFCPDLKNTQILDSFSPGNPTGTKTTWDEQHYMAAEHIIRDLIKANVIKTSGQVIDYARLTDASCYKAAEIIYYSLGKAYTDQLKTAREKYKEALQSRYYFVDLDRDTRITEIERHQDVHMMTR